MKTVDVTKARDPRTDPQPGDVVQKGSSFGFTVRKVIRRDGGNVHYCVGDRKLLCWIQTWKTWCLDAKVIQTTPQP